MESALSTNSHTTVDETNELAKRQEMESQYAQSKEETRGGYDALPAL